jgi:hypothetical protein
MRRAFSLAAALASCAASAAGSAQPPAPGAPAATPAPLSPGQAALGRRLAELGDLNAILIFAGHAEIERTAATTPGLTDAERARLREVGERVAGAQRMRILAAAGDVYARHFTAAQLRAIIAFLESPPGRAYVGALPQVLPRVAAAMEGVDLGREVRAAFCRETGKLCEAH